MSWSTPMKYMWEKHCCRPTLLILGTSFVFKDQAALARGLRQWHLGHAKNSGSVQQDRTWLSIRLCPTPKKVSRWKNSGPLLWSCGESYSKERAFDLQDRLHPWCPHSVLQFQIRLSARKMSLGKPVGALCSGRDGFPSICWRSTHTTVQRCQALFSAKILC